MPGEGEERGGDHPRALLSTIQHHPHAHILTMAGKSQVMCAEPILHCYQGECGMSQEVVTGTTAGHMEKRAMLGVRGYTQC